VYASAMRCAKVVGCVAAVGLLAGALPGLGLLGGCGDDDERSCRGIERNESALFGAGVDAGSPQADGVVALLAQTGARSAELCSGAVIASNVVLTARHCAKPLPGRNARVLFGPSLQDPTRAVAIVDFIVDEERDIALAVLDSGSVLREPPTVLPLALRAEISVGDRATLAGFGLDEDGNFGERRFVDEPIVDLDDELVVVDGAGASGACTGDSGGPLLLRTALGELRVAGVLSVGSASCNAIDVYQRVAPVADWLSEQLDRLALELEAFGGC
jgi:hypothetical protein